MIACRRRVFLKDRLVGCKKLKICYVKENSFKILSIYISAVKGRKFHFLHLKILTRQSVDRDEIFFHVWVY